MDFIQLEEFFDLSHTCNFQETADNLHTSQSNISKHLQKLEDELGVKLFFRTSRFAELNEYGRVFSEYAQQILELYNVAQQRLNVIKAGNDVILNIGFHPLLGQYGLIELISEFKRQNPLIEIKFYENCDVEYLLKTIHCDIVFAGDGEIPLGDVKVIPFIHDRMVAVVPKNHSLSDEEIISLDQLKGNTIFINLGTSADVSHINDFFAGATSETTIISTVTRSSNILRFVGEDCGTALLFKGLANTQDATICSKIKILDVIPEISSTFSAYYLKNKPITSALHLFIDFLRTYSAVSTTN